MYLMLHLVGQLERKKTIAFRARSGCRQHTISVCGNGSPEPPEIDAADTFMRRASAANSSHYSAALHLQSNPLHEIVRQICNLMSNGAGEEPASILHVTCTEPRPRSYKTFVFASLDLYNQLASRPPMRDYCVSLCSYL
jgi:hypothetical protein